MNKVHDRRRHGEAMDLHFLSFKYIKHKIEIINVMQKNAPKIKNPENVF